MENPSPLLMRHFTQALDGIGATKHFTDDLYRVRRTEDVITEVGYRYHLGDRIWWVGIRLSDGTGYRPGNLLTEVTYERVWWDDRTNRQHRSIATDYATFYNPVRAAEYVAGLLGYVPKSECECEL